MENEEINSKILKLWKDFPEKIRGKYWPLLFPKFKKNSLLFVGLNPSLSKKGIKYVIKKSGYEGEIKSKKSLKYPNPNLKPEEIIELEKAAFENYSYFEKFKKLSEKLGIAWAHIDLFVYRLTKQGDFKEKIGIYKNKKGEVLWDNPKKQEFGVKQLKIASDSIQKLKPKIIVVANAFASDIINSNPKLFKLNNNPEEFDKNGHDTITIGNDKVPIIFTSMLTRGALDNHSFRRLKWDIKNAIKKRIN